MAIAVRLQPELTQVRSGTTTLQVASLALGGVPRGGVVLLTGAGGLRSLEVVDTLNGLAEHGYEAVAADLGEDVDPDDGREGDVVALRHVHVLQGQLAARGWSPDQTAVVGYGAGGHVALLAAASLELGAAVSVRPVFPRPPTSRPVSALRTPWLGLFGAGDDRCPPSEVAALAATVAATSVVFTQVVTYPGVDGGFLHDVGDSRAHAAAFDSWQRTVEWLAARVVPRPTPLAQAWSDRLARIERLSA